MPLKSHTVPQSVVGAFVCTESMLLLLMRCAVKQSSMISMEEQMIGPDKLCARTVRS